MTIDKEKQWKAEWGTPIKVAHGSSNARGAAILLHNGFDCKIKRKIVDPVGRYWIISDSLHDMVGNIDIVSPIKMDHSAITLQLHKIEEGVKGPGFWKMNTSMLNDAAYGVLTKCEPASHTSHSS